DDFAFGHELSLSLDEQPEQIETACTDRDRRGIAVRVQPEEFAIAAMKAEAFEQEYIDRVAPGHAFGSRQPARSRSDSDVARGGLPQLFGISLQRFWKILDWFRRTLRTVPVIAFSLVAGGFDHIINARIDALIWLCDWVAGPLAMRDGDHRRGAT